MGKLSYIFKKNLLCFSFFFLFNLVSFISIFIEALDRSVMNDDRLRGREKIINW